MKLFWVYICFKCQISEHFFYSCGFAFRRPPVRLGWYFFKSIHHNHMCVCAMCAGQ